MSLTNAAETALLNLLFVNTDWANIGDAAGLQNSAAAGNFYLSLHTSDPGETGNQTTNEASYTGYARVAVARTGGGWTVLGANVSNAAEILFSECTAGSATVTHFGIGTDSSGAGNLLFYGPLDSSLAISSGVSARFTAGNLAITAD